MPPLNWAIFESLPGGAQLNFEMLCRALVRRHYSRYGAFATLAAQPGVEFHLQLRSPCALGNAGRWYGWQCRWYDLPGGRAVGTSRRRKIKEAIATTENELPCLTDWVLWTRRQLTKGDQKWFLGLETHMRLHVWSGAEVEEHLSGDAEIFRGTYFGELVLTPERLAELHAAAVAPISRRWRPEVHQVIDAERALRRMLGETDTWRVLPTLAHKLNADATAVEDGLSDLRSPENGTTSEVAKMARAASVALANAYFALERGDLDLLGEDLATRQVAPATPLAVLPRRLRAIRHRVALAVTNALADIRSASGLLGEIDQQLGVRLTAVVADAGCGKTQLAAQLSAATQTRSAGILLHGRTLHARHTLDSVAQAIVIQGTPVASMEVLVAAVDAAGQRGRRRLPIIIDGLNEAEDPRDWKSLLASLVEVLRRYPYVLVIVTLRGEFADDVVPEHIERLEIHDFGRDAMAAVRQYFQHFRIDPVDAELPWELLAHPLTLQLFCEVTNPKREKTVGVEAMPESLTALFDRYLEQARKRITELAPQTRRYYEQDVQTALDNIGIALWEERNRSLEMSKLRQRLGDETRPWNESIVHALEQDGVLLRVPGDRPATTDFAVVYDALAGHLVANSVVARLGQTRIIEWLKDEATMTAFSGQMEDRHPLAEDTFRALIGVIPRRLYKQLWTMLDEPMRTEAITGAANLDGPSIDAETVAELAKLVVAPLRPPIPQRDLFRRLWRTRSSASHPLNSQFLDSVLGPMSVADRDLLWTEWIRRNYEGLLRDAEFLEQRWRQGRERTSADQLRARWIKWALTSTVRRLRDQITRSLYWFGRFEARALFGMTLESLALNDPYVTERLLAASYGVALAHQAYDAKFAEELALYLSGLRDALTGEATCPTDHWLSRMYVQQTVEFAKTRYPDSVSEGLINQGADGVRFASGHAIEPIQDDDPRAPEIGRAVQMDFENYTLGRLFDDRANYDMKHLGHQAALAHVRGTIWTMGWRKDGLGAVDENVSSLRSMSHWPATERYGKKYGWIGFYTYAGTLTDNGRLPPTERLSDVPIDPSFPDPPDRFPIELPIWARDTPSDVRRWIRRGMVRVPDEHFYSRDIGTYPGPWLAVYGNVNTGQQTPGRHVWGLLTALLVAPRDVDRFVTALNREQYPGNRWIPREPSEYYTFAGEIPWSSEFGFNADGEQPQLYRGTVDVGDASPVIVEILAHRYSWESYHSELNKAGGALVPSKPFSSTFDLRSVPQSFNQVLPDGTLGALSFAAPDRFDGHLLYLREDLLHRYAEGRQLVWFIWGERQIRPYPFPTPDWIVDAARSGADIWRHVRRGGDLSSAFAPRRQRRPSSTSRVGRRRKRG
jgi:hypothetical protein